MELIPDQEQLRQSDTHQFLKANGFEGTETIESVGGGHMAYQRFYVYRGPSPSPDLFVKAYDTSLFTDSKRALHSIEYLKKEALIYDYLNQNRYLNIPSNTGLLPEGHLFIEPLDTNNGWEWRAPTDTSAKYIISVLDALTELQMIPVPKDTSPKSDPYDCDYFFPQRIMQVYQEEGCGSITDQKIDTIQTLANKWLPYIHDNFQSSAIELLRRIEALANAGARVFDNQQQIFFCHHDARQANIAWHPEKGVRLVDWSWADVGLKNADTTMFLIDMAKSGFEVSGFLDQYFNPDHALILINHWLGRSTEPTRDGDPTVRFHQFTSAIVAYNLLSNVINF